MQTTLDAPARRLSETDFQVCKSLTTMFHNNLDFFASLRDDTTVIKFKSEQSLEVQFPDNTHAAVFYFKQFIADDN